MLKTKSTHYDEANTTMIKQVEVKVLCKLCKQKFTLINTYSNAYMYICVKCTFPKVIENKTI